MLKCIKRWPKSWTFGDFVVGILLTLVIVIIPCGAIVGSYIHSLYKLANRDEK